MNETNTILFQSAYLRRYKYFYTLFMYGVTAFLILQFWFKSFYFKPYRFNFKQRFCRNKHTPTKYDIWINTASLGEVITAVPLIHQLLEKNLKLLITTTTPTGAAEVIKRFGTQVTHVLMPYDLPPIIKKFFMLHQPRVAIFYETMLFLNLPYYCITSNIPLIFIYPRLKDAFMLAKVFKPLVQAILNHATQIYVEDNIEHFLAFDIDPKKISRIGSMKFDLDLHHVDHELIKKFTKQINRESKMIITAASTHPKEEQELLLGFKKLQQHYHNAILLIAPRHPQRFTNVYTLAKNVGFKTGLRSQLDAISPEHEVIIVDSLGELLSFYKMSDYAFVGGTLTPIGGHNVLEPIAMGCPVLIGKHFHNFTFVCNKLLQEEALIIIKNGLDFAKQIIKLHSKLGLRHKITASATEVFEKNKGAAQICNLGIEHLFQHLSSLSQLKD